MSHSTGQKLIGGYTDSPTEEQIEAINTIKQKASELIDFIDQLENTDPRRKAAAFTDFEKGVMMAVKAIV